MNIVYSSDGSPLWAQIDTGYCFAPLPIASFTPLEIDWESITYEPTREAIQSAWDAWVAAESPNLDHASPDYAFRPRPDLVPQEPALPDWQGFLNALDLPPTGNGLFEAMLGINLAISLNAYQLCLSFVKNTGAEQEIRTLSWLYGTLLPSLTAEQQQDLQDAIAQHNIPVTLP